MLDNKINMSRERGCRQARGAYMHGGNPVGEWQRIVRVSVVTALLLGGLAGCGGSDDGGSSTSPTPPPTSQLSAVDGFSVVRPGVATRVDLSTYVRGPGAKLKSISSEQPDCSATNLSGLAVDITSESGLCEFSYEVSGQGVGASATLNTLASTLAEPVLPPLSQTMTLAEPSKAFDLVALLGADWPTDYNLDPASLLVQGGSAQGTVTTSGNTLTYTPPNATEPVWNQILFVLKNPARPDEDVMGALYITVSDSANQPPVIGVPKYDYNAQTGATVVTMQTVTLDLATLPNLNITEPDDGEWQLVEVQSYSSSVVPVDPTSVTNKKFTFQAAVPGNHVVTYIVGDHEAGFSVGLINIKVGVDESPKTWNDITIGENVYQATPLYSEVINRGVIAEPVYDDGVANYVAGVTGVAAQSYCSNGNHLATLEELELLRTTSAANSERAKYPVERTYITHDSGGQPITYRLDSGATAPYDPATSPMQYVICVTMGNMTSYTPGSTEHGIDTGLSDGEWWSLGTLISTGGANEPVVTDSVNIGSTPLSEANVQLNPPGCVGETCKVEVQGDATTYGQFTAQVANALDPAVTVTIPLTLLQDAKVVGAAIGVDNSPADGSTANTVVVSVTDKVGNPLADTLVKLKYSAPAGVTISPASCEAAETCTAVTTDSNGKLTLSLTTTTPGSYAITFPEDALVWGLPTSRPDPTCDATAGAGQGKFATPDGILRNWSDANSYCTGQGMRMPTRDELVALYNAYPNDKMASVCGWPTYDYYWSSTESGSDSHYYVRLLDGHVIVYGDLGTGLVACVR
ncbi:adhesion domain-containing protein [Aeromonas sanarellii]|uniref:adhesion domain-containing protein n=1 Tax=Aeromonas sanarellii TaxID=633415 RepID=UPI0039871349